MNSRNPKFWALIGFGVGAVIASAGTIVHPLDSLFGGLIQAAIWFGVSSFILNKKSVKSLKLPSSTSPRYSSRNSEIVNKKSITLTSVKTCSNCGVKVPTEYSWCSKCYGTNFSHSQTPNDMGFNKSEEGSLNSPEYLKVKYCLNCKLEVPMSQAWCGNCTSAAFVFKDVVLEPVELKTCPMCAERIKIVAKKCRYCQHLMAE